MCSTYLLKHTERKWPASSGDGPGLGLEFCFDFLFGKRKTIPNLILARLFGNLLGFLIESVVTVFCKFIEELEIAGHTGYPYPGETEQ